MILIIKYKINIVQYGEYLIFKVMSWLFRQITWIRLKQLI